MAWGINLHVHTVLRHGVGCSVACLEWSDGGYRAIGLNTHSAVSVG